MAEDKDKQDEEELVIVEDGDKSKSPKDDDEGEEEGKSAKGKEAEASEESDESDDDERVGHASTEDDERREAKRRERKEGNKRRKEARDRTYKELEFLRRRNEALERRFSDLDVRSNQNEAAALESRIAAVKTNIREAEQVMAAAVKEARGDDLVEATRIKEDLQRGLNQLLGAQNGLEQARRNPKPQAPSPEMEAYAHDFKRDNPWWDPAGRDQDSRVVSAIDNQLAREGGYDPTTQDYWDELTRRVQKRLPHKFEADKRRKDDGPEDDDEDDEETTPQRKNGGGPRFSTGGRERPLRKNEVYVSPERKAAMEEAGVWDDPILRKRYLKQYQAYDQQHRQDRSAH